MNQRSNRQPSRSNSVDRRGFLDTSMKAVKSSAVVAVLSQLSSIRAAAAESMITQEPSSEEDFESLADEYSLSEGISYLNHASIGTMPRKVQKLLNQFLAVCESNPWLHIWGQEWKEPREDVRRLAAELMGCDSKEIAITHNTTEMFNTLAAGLPLAKTDEVLFSSLCHAGACEPFLYRAKQGLFQARRFDFPVNKLPGMTADEVVNAYRNEIRANTRVLVIPHLDNTVGIRYPVSQMSQMAKENGVEFVAVDAAQTPGMIPMDCSQMNVDVVATSGHKWIGGPKGTGLAYVNRSLHATMQPLWVTWGQRQWSGSARRYEDYGTRNMAEVLALGDSIRFVNQINSSRREKRLRELWEFTQDLVERTDSLEWKSPQDWDLAGSLYCIQVSRPAARLASELFEKQGVIVRPFTTLGLNHLRVSPNVFTTKRELERAMKLIA